MVAGIQYTGLNGSPEFKLTEAEYFQTHCAETIKIDISAPERAPERNDDPDDDEPYMQMLRFLLQKICTNPTFGKRYRINRGLFQASPRGLFRSGKRRQSQTHHEIPGKWRLLLPEQGSGRVFMRNL
jgi:hypothetical protein